MRKLAALFLLTSIFLAGCGTDVSQNENEPTEETTVEENETTGNSEEVTETEEPQENTEEVTEEPAVEEETPETTEETEGTTEGTTEETTKEPEAGEEQEIMTESEAIYVGQADTHSIEIETADQEVMILQTLESDVDFDSINEGSKVNIDYYIDENGQSILKSMTVVN